MPRAVDDAGDMQAPLLDASVEAPAPMPVAAAFYAAPQQAAPAPPAAVYEDPAQDAMADDLEWLMAQNGLAEEDMAKLRAEGVTTVEIYRTLDDTDIEASGVDIAQRREAKLARDTVNVVAFHAESLERQVQGVLDQVGLSPPARRALQSIATVDELKELDPRTLAELGVGLLERKKVQAFVATEYCTTLLPLPRPVVLTYP